MAGLLLTALLASVLPVDGGFTFFQAGTTHTPSMLMPCIMARTCHSR